MKHSNGFTLIEVIIIMTIMAIAAAMFVSTMGTSFTQSPASAGLVNKQYQLIQKMEIITSVYRKELQEGTLNLNTFKTYIDTNYSGYASTQLMTISDSTSTFTTNNVLLVTLTDGDQKLQSIFTN
ncbi:MAG: hypothetical protein CVU52_00035 [Deltaproteobacteria bacterium HGW-Deltaproteobacteria-10]|nr:MAG: hypothetical protein CVU52_00035 [Deltaproteobacteria bacterium HGW-Deltaproteobacteria-10]